MLGLEGKLPSFEMDENWGVPQHDYGNLHVIGMHSCIPGRIAIGIGNNNTILYNTISWLKIG